MKIETIQISELEFDPNNARKHDDKNLSAIKGSLSKFGQRKPIVVDAKNVIVAGNGTVEAAMALDWTEIEAVRIPDDWTADQIKAFALADNRTAELAVWDHKVLSEQLLELHELEWDIKDLGFEMPDLLDPVVVADDEIPEIDEVEVRSKLGDKWKLGNHLLVCGDSTHASTYESLMSGETAAMMFTDPPWNVAIGKDSNPRHRQREGLENDDLSPEQFSEFLKSFASCAIKYVDGDVYCVLGASEWPTLDLNLRQVGFHWSATVIWVKDVFVLGRSKYHRRYEPIWYGWNKKGKSSFQNRRDLDDVWEIPRPRRSDEHPTMKPVELMVRAIENSSAKGDIVLEPFGGSGSTLLACEQTGRHARVIELEPRYCDVIISRWEAMTGKTAELVI